MATTITCADAKTFIQQDDAVIFDVRDAASYDTGHIANAISVTRDNLEEMVQDLTSDQPVLVYCHRGIRSQVIADHLGRIGFTEVHSLEGGFTEWQRLEEE